MDGVTRRIEGATLGVTRAVRGPLAVLLALLTLAFTASGPAWAVDGARWVRDFWPTAKAAGISRSTYDRALKGFQPDPDVLKRASNQPEFKTEVWDYVDKRVSKTRIENGLKVLSQHRRLFDDIERRYALDRYTIAAIWGMESAYGAIFNNKALIKPTIRSLATLASSGGRLQKYGRTQLIAALKVIQRGDIHPEGMTGSWAGAMGHTQFIPTTFDAYAVDFDGDGRRNIWTSIPDALGSAAAYLDTMGWRKGQTWGYEVTVPTRHAGSKTERSLGEWARLGVRRVGGRDFPRPGDKARLYQPAGAYGPSFLLIRNFKVIKRYNNSDFYALAVGHLADRLRGGGPFATPWPAHAFEDPLTDDERKKLQILLTMLGHYDGAIDGDIGRGSRAAIRAYQTSAGLAPDGVESRSLLKHLEKGT